jgi:N-acetylmuramoyl-L-alanine amidase
MRFSSGARGLAAAMLMLLLGTFNPTPSRAWQMNFSTTAPTPTAPAQAVAADPAPAVQPALAAPDQVRPILQPAVQTIVPQPADETAELRSAAADKASQDCLATAVYFEAKGESLRGQRAVAEVIINRTRSGRFPSSICGVVKQRGQFSFVHGGRLPGVPRDCAAWHKAVAVARMAMDGAGERVASNALFFHARSVSAGWHAVRVAQIGNHLFYR